MPNGTGKTTTLDMLTATLNGEARNWSPEDIRELKGRESQTSIGSFKINLKADNVPITIELRLDFDTGTAQYRTTSPQSGGVEPGWVPPANLYPFLSSEFIRLFVFNGEFANRLLDDSASEAEKAIDALCHLYLLENVANVATKDWEMASKNSTGKSKANLRTWQNKLDTVKDRINKIEQAKNKAIFECEKLREHNKELHNKISSRLKSDDSVRDQFHEAEKKRKDALENLETYRDRLLDKLRQPQQIHTTFEKSLVQLKSNLDRLKLPDSTSSTFFKELSEELSCICGRYIGPAERQEILKRSESYLDVDETGVINTIKQSIADAVENQNDQFDAVQQKLTQSIKSLRVAETQVEALEKKSESQGDDEISLWRNSIQKNEDRLRNLTNLLDEINGIGDGMDDKNQKSLKALNKIRMNSETRVSEITGTIQLREQKEIITKLCESVRSNARQRIRAKVLRECNSRLLTILGSDPLQLKSIDKCLKLKGQSSGSVGQVLSVGYAFLLTALRYGDNDFPLIVDSPAGSLDDSRRTEIGSLIPDNCNQFIAFMISTERNYFLDAIESGTSEAIRYITAFRKTSGVKHLINSLPSGNETKQTDNSVIVEGRDYFVNFTAVEEK